MHVYINFLFIQYSLYSNNLPTPFIHLPILIPPILPELLLLCIGEGKPAVLVAVVALLVLPPVVAVVVPLVNADILKAGSVAELRRLPPPPPVFVVPLVLVLLGG